MKQEITAIILAGGRSSRMGRDKGLLKINNCTLVERTVQLLEQVCRQITIITNNPVYQNFGIPLYPDVLKGCGPAGGIHAGLSHTQTQFNLLLACDMPFLSGELLNQLIQYIDGDSEAIVPVFKHTPQPLCAIYSKQTLYKFENYILQGHLKMRWIIEQLNTKYITIDRGLDCYAPKLFENINTEEDLLRIKNQFDD
ncbi:MAG: molybdenum cofactor guanylyltransferase [Flavobacteriales bacterium]